MEYFKKFPTIEYSNNVAVNILARNKIRDDLLNNIYVYYPYTVKDSERPDTLATAYYGNYKYTWLIFYANNIIDPVREWVLTERDFVKYLNYKYKEENYSTLWRPGVHYKENDTVYFEDGVHKDMVFICISEHTSSSIFGSDDDNFDSNFDKPDEAITDPLDPRYGTYGINTIASMAFEQQNGELDVSDCGINYQVGDILTVIQPIPNFGVRNADAIVVVTAVTSTGAVTGIRRQTSGSLYVTGAVSVTGGSGTGCFLNITSTNGNDTTIENPDNKWKILSMTKRAGFQIANQTIHEYRNQQDLIVDWESWYSDIVVAMNNPANLPSNWIWSDHDNSQVVRVVNANGVIEHVTPEKYFVPTPSGGFWAARFSKSRLAVNLTQQYNPNQIAFTIYADGSKRPVSKFTYENDLNESRRFIKLIDRVYASQIFEEFRSLFSKQFN